MKTIKSPLLILFLAGALLNLSFFFTNIATDLLAFFVIAPAFVALAKLKAVKRYLGGLLFFGAWMLPTSYWYFNFMPVGEAIRSLTLFTLMALIFVLPVFIKTLIKNKSIALDFALIIFLWTSLVFLRTTLPVVEDWWIPHLAYTQWQNVGVLQIAYFAGIYGIIFVILLSNALLAFLWLKTKKVFPAVFIISLSLIFLLGNFLVTAIHTAPVSGKDRLIAIQASTESLNWTLDQSLEVAEKKWEEDKDFFTPNDNDLEKLKNLTLEALKKIENREITNIFVLWPENRIGENKIADVKSFAKNNKIYLSFHSLEKAQTDKFYSVIITLDQSGEEVLRNYKRHIAPGESNIAKDGEHHNFEVDGLKITSDICYDLHYPDLQKMAEGNDLLLAPVNDLEFGEFLPYLHARDVIFRAIENRINILTSATTGPTFFVNKYGVIEKGLLEIGEEGFVIFGDGVE